MVKIESLSFTYKKGAPIFSGFCWTIAAGERWAIIGPSGCGKTTLLYLLAGLLRPTAGAITISDGHLVNRKAVAGLVLQDYGLFPWATAYQNVSLGLKIQGYDKLAIHDITTHWLAELGIESVASHYPGEMSGGQRQRVAIARTLALEPSLLLLDEPFASLDALTREDLLDLTLALWNKKPSTMVLVTHNIEEAAFWGNKIMILQHAPNYQPQIVDNLGSGIPEYKDSAEYFNRCKVLRSMIEPHSREKKSEDRP
jgi:ABC-type nitrate/sulfonate/bicarbonate transport system ATPase subunit